MSMHLHPKAKYRSSFLHCVALLVTLSITLRLAIPSLKGRLALALSYSELRMIRCWNFDPDFGGSSY